MIASCHMVPGPSYPDAAGAGAAIIALAIVVSTSCPDPVAIHPDVIRAGCCGTGIDDIGGLGLYVSIYSAAGESQQAACDGYGQ